MSNKNRMETADDAIQSLLADMYTGTTSGIDILAEPDVPNTPIVIRDRDELERKAGTIAGPADADIPFLDESDLEEITEYAPRHALVVMKPEDAYVADKVIEALKGQGVEVAHKDYDVGAISYMGRHAVDILVTGMGFDPIVQYTENRRLSKGTFSVAVSDNGVKADVKFEDNEGLVRYVQSGKLMDDYLANDDAQRAREATSGDIIQLATYIMDTSNN